VSTRCTAPPRRFLTTALVTAPDRARFQLPTALATAPFSSDRLSCSTARHARTRASVPEVIDEVHGLSHAPRMVETVERPPRVPGHDRTSSATTSILAPGARGAHVRCACFWAPMRSDSRLPSSDVHNKKAFRSSAPTLRSRATSRGHLVSPRPPGTATVRTARARRPVRPRGGVGAQPAAPPARARRVRHRRAERVYGVPAPAQRLDPVSELVLTILSQNTADLNSERAFEALRATYPSGGPITTHRLVRPDGTEAAARGWAASGWRRAFPPDWSAARARTSARLSR